MLSSLGRSRKPHAASRTSRTRAQHNPSAESRCSGKPQLLESNALNYLGKPSEARTAAQKARVHFVEAREDAFALALVDYFEGSAASFACDYSGAWKLLRAAHDEFLNYGQENWQGRAEAALGTVLMNRGSAKSALAFFDGALRNLHPERDEAAYASTLINRGCTLVRLSRLDAAKATYAKALSMARRLNMTVSILMIRTGLALIDLASGKVARALMLFERIGQEARSLDLSVDVLCAELRIAECLGRMGREQDMLDRVERWSASPEAESLRHDQALRELFESVKNRNVNRILVKRARSRRRLESALWRPARTASRWRWRTISKGPPRPYTGDFPSAWRLLKGARSEFQMYGQENWQGRSEAALGVLLLSKGRCQLLATFP